MYGIGRSWLKPDTGRLQLAGWQWAVIGLCLAAGAGLVMGLIFGLVLPNGPSTGGQQIAIKAVALITVIGSGVFIPLQRRRGIFVASLFFHTQISMLWLIFTLAFQVSFAGQRVSDDVATMIFVAWGSSLILGQALLLIQHILWPPRPKKPGAFCPDCSYPLKGLNDRQCPECGRKFTLDELGVTETALRV